MFKASCRLYICANIRQTVQSNLTQFDRQDLADCDLLIGRIPGTLINTF